MWITRNEYDTKLKALKEKQEDIIIQKEEHNNADENFYLTVSHVLSLAKRAKDLFLRSEIDEKRQLLNLLLQNCTLDGKNLNFELKTPFDTVLKANSCSTMLRCVDMFRTLNWPLIKNNLKLLTIEGFTY